MNQGHSYRERLPAAAEGCTLLEYLVARWRHGSEAEWRARIERQELLLDGRVATAETLLATGRQLVWRRPPWEEPAVPLSFALLHLDDHLLAVAKPAGLPTMPSGGRFLEHTLLHQVRRRWPEAVPLHRLDRGTSGIVLFARTALARREVGRAWREGGVRRLYRGLVSGHVGPDALALDLPIGEVSHPRIGRAFAVTPEGRPSKTHAKVLERRGGSADATDPATTLVTLEIDSGRPHQIRIHLAHAGHPLVGESFYGAGGRPHAAATALPGDIGYRLHAERLILLHPQTGRTLDVACIPPSNLRPRLGEPSASP